MRYMCPSCPSYFDKPGQCDTLGCGRTLIPVKPRPERKPKNKK